MLATLGYLTVDLAVRLLPARPLDACATIVARLLFALRVPARARIEDNLARLRPGLDPAARRALARRAFEHFALSLLDFMRLARLAPGALERAIEVRGAEHLERARAAGRGVILLSAHLGNWFAGGVAVARRGVPVRTVLYRNHAGGFMDQRVARRGNV
ncbi:MAG: hypothetical protein HYR74_08180, partial [Candidatus Eisenbacteria bacterium]|nr:hypothetical protein [Candidatus Eisenbacteria bacterium]